MRGIIIILLIFIIVLAILLASTIVLAHCCRSREPIFDLDRNQPLRQNAQHANQYVGGERSKLEERVIRALEGIFQGRYKFDQAHPEWLRDNHGPPLELDGYNDELKVAVEVQGPGHIKPIPGEPESAYEKRITRDAYKRRECAKRGVHLITIDYRISPASYTSYLRSRLYDAGVPGIERSFDYIKELDMTPWHRGMQ